MLIEINIHRRKDICKFDVSYRGEKKMILKEREENIILMVWYWYVSRKSYYEFVEKEIGNMTIMTKKKLHNFRILSSTKKDVINILWTNYNTYIYYIGKIFMYEDCW